MCVHYTFARVRALHSRIAHLLHDVVLKLRQLVAVQLKSVTHVQSHAHALQLCSGAHLIVPALALQMKGQVG